MKKPGTNEREFVVVAVSSVEKARMVMLATGLFEPCPGSDDVVIGKESGVQVRLIPTLVETDATHPPICQRNQK